MRYSLLILLACPVLGFTAPPTLTNLYPAGGQLGSTVEVLAGGTFPKWPVQAWCSEPKIEITPLKDKGKLTIKIPADVLPKPVWIRLHDGDGSSAPRPFMLGRLPELAEKEPNDETAKSQPITGNALVNGKLDKSGDVDTYRMTLKKGETLVAFLLANEVIASPVDAVLQMLTADGFVVAQDHDTHGLDPQIAYAAPRDGEYLVRVFGFPSAPDSSIRLYGADTIIYRLMLTTGPFPDHVIPLAVSRKQPGRVRLSGWNIPPDLVELPAEINGNEAWVNHPKLPELVPMRLIDEPTLVEGAKDYTPPFALTRRITKEDETQMLSVIGKKGQPLHISTHSRQMGLGVTPILRILSSSLEVLAKAVPPQLNTDSELRFTPAADGPFTIEVRDQFGQFGPRSEYLLRVRTPLADFDATIPSDRIGVKPGATTDVIVTVTRRDGLTGDLLAEVEGLPAGVTMKELPPTKGKGDGKTITLQFHAEETAKSGPFRLVLKSAGKTELTRTARATIPEQTPAVTEYLWLAVTADPTPPPPKKKKK
ncbi:PPC domain-containing protein [Zavarzinella formosa]|uniref:PPC domain-containing protein n=1 Tax=Zavarzinella formosa TaxID=360055 RepID=UPI00037D49CD|nr:PPC domain-containing protein [Zavarzinella formosa]